MRGTLPHFGGWIEYHGIIPAYAGNTTSLLVISMFIWDHPRVCGEHQELDGFPRTRVGSSPRMRGTRNSRRNSRPFPGDHPRVCGEHEQGGKQWPRLMGSSPRMRGTRSERRRHSQVRGIIPAYAGNTVASLPPCSCCWDHPRVCGEHRAVPEPLVRDGGSSPRMRGTLGFARFHTLDAGIIPAYAGNTVSAWLVPCSIRDHPRVCGEHLDTIASQLRLAGSSPRMRGTPDVRPSRRTRAGIIPAYAGNTFLSKLSAVGLRDHPRVCGEHHDYSRRAYPLVGSSPRMRGTHEIDRNAGRKPGIIPAYAGNTTAIGAWANQQRDHPRVCGEHFSRTDLRWTLAGSSPRMRGTRDIHPNETGAKGIIPAYAGNTCELWRDGASPWGSSPRMRGTHLSAGASATYRGIIPAYAGNTNLQGIGIAQWRDHPRVCGEHQRHPCRPYPTWGSSPRMRGTLLPRQPTRHWQGIIPAYAGNTAPALA